MPEPHEGLRLAAPAKLNLWLHVVGRRADGYHELDSLLVLLELADTLAVRDDDGFVVAGPYAAGVPTDEGNLAWRGWIAGFGSESPRGGLEVKKTIPVAAGLGGGSSDAAAGWRLARHLAEGTDPTPDAETLTDLAAIGADVPFFAARMAVARVTGIGERVAAAADEDAQDVVLVHPPFALSTAAVFGELTPADWSTVEPEATTGRNDLLAPARRLRPELADVIRLIERTGGQPRLSGSGPTIFALTDDPERADHLAGRLAASGLATTRTRLRSEPASIEPR